MLGENHDIFHEFPEFKDRIEGLAEKNPDFCELMGEHDVLDKEIRDLEIANQPVADEYMEDLKKKRIALKDQLYDLIRDHVG